MLKGIEKQVIVLNKTDSKIFEQAIFILKENKDFSRIDLLKECEKIISENDNKKSKKNTLKNKFIVVGFLISVSLVILLSIILICLLL